MGNDIFIPGDEILILGKVKKNAGNYILATIVQPPDYRETEFLIDKAQICRFMAVTAPIMVEHIRMEGQDPILLDVEKVANLGIVREIDANGNPSEYRWIQDLNKIKSE